MKPPRRPYRIRNGLPHFSQSSFQSFGISSRLLPLGSDFVRRRPASFLQPRKRPRRPDLITIGAWQRSHFSPFASSDGSDFVLLHSGKPAQPRKRPYLFQRIIIGLPHFSQTMPEASWPFSDSISSLARSIPFMKGSLNSLSTSVHFRSPSSMSSRFFSIFAVKPSSMMSLKCFTSLSLISVPSSVGKSFRSSLRT